MLKFDCCVEGLLCLSYLPVLDQADTEGLSLTGKLAMKINTLLTSLAIGRWADASEGKKTIGCDTLVITYQS